MPTSTIPVEILESIIEEVISGHSNAKQGVQYSVTYLPRWYLTPLLRVSKQWYAVSAKHLYQTIAVGSNSRTREGQKIAEDLRRTLSTNSRLAVLVKKLQLGIGRIDGENPGDLNWPRDPERPKRRIRKLWTWHLRKTPDSWSQTNIRILQLCPNVEHVEIRGFEHPKLDALVDVLKKKSLVSFCITTHCLSDSIPKRGLQFSQLLDMMRSWPKLRSIRAEDFLDDMSSELMLDASQVSGCCPDLREIIITGAALQASELKLIRALCSGAVGKLAVSLYGCRVSSTDSAAVDALCECLRAWSYTLQYFKMDVRSHCDSYPPLDEAISTLMELRELQVTIMKLDFGPISQLPRLERFFCVSRHSVEELQPLLHYLEDLEKFSSLNLIVLPIHIANSSHMFTDDLEKICRGRRIEVGWDLI